MSKFTQVCKSLFLFLVSLHYPFYYLSSRPLSFFLLGWFPLTKPIKPHPEDKGSEGEEDEEKKEKEEKKSKKKKQSEIRLEMQFKKNTPPKEVLTGIILNVRSTFSAE